MGELIFFIILCFFMGVVYPVGAIIYLKLIKHSKMSISEILNII
jgi:hypothetical protein